MNGLEENIKTYGMENVRMNDELLTLKKLMSKGLQRIAQIQDNTENGNL